MDKIIFQIITVGQMEANCYLLGSALTREAIIIDPGDDYSKIKDSLNRLNLKPKLIINTHGHIDHIGANDKFSVPIYIHRLDSDHLTDPEKNLSAIFGAPYKSPAASRQLSDKDRVLLDEISLVVIHTPGHTPGSICLKFDDIVFTGDSLFHQGIGRTDFPGASEVLLLSSVRERLMNLKDNVKIYPGHGPSSTIGEEKRYNPFLT